MPQPRYRADYLEALRDWACRAERSPAGVVADLAYLVGRAEGWPSEAWASLPAEPGGSLPPLPPSALRSPELLGQAYEAMLAHADRRRHGAYFTPVPVARRLVEIALDGRAAGADRVLSANIEVGDPSVGGGVFLLAAARQLADRGARAGSGPSMAARIVREDLWGADVDATAVGVTRLALAWWAWRQDSPRSWPSEAGRRVIVADALVDDGVWPAGEDGRARTADATLSDATGAGATGADATVSDATGAGAVVGNPPFLGQLKRPTARRPEAVAGLTARYGNAARGYVDTAALFLLAACRFAPAGTRVVLILPESALVAAHAGPVRAAVLERSRLVGLWLGGPGVFRAGVRVCAPVLDVGTPHRQSGEEAATIWTGPNVEAATPAEVTPRELAESRTWGSLSARHRGIPACRPDTNGTVGDLATATAGFRDQFYGLAPHVREHDAATNAPTAPLITSGVIGPARCGWGTRPVRFAGRAWRAPVVDLDDLMSATPVLARWVDARLRPKLLVATQSTVVEAVADPAGRWVPSVPVVSVEPGEADYLWRLLAVLLSPVATAWALERYGGAGLSASAVKLSARQLLELPLPQHLEAWESAAAFCRSASGQENEQLWRHDLMAAGRLMNAAYGLDVTASGDLQRWWAGRLPPPARSYH